MAEVDVEDLRKKSQLLLESLKLNQSKLQESLTETFGLNTTGTARDWTSGTDTLSQGPTSDSTKIIKGKKYLPVSPKATRQVPFKLVGGVSATQDEEGKQMLINEDTANIKENGDDKVNGEFDGCHADTESGFITPPNSPSTVSSVLERTRTSTPKRDPKPRQKQPESPKSILKRRKLIDDHIPVDSKYPHPDINALTPKKNLLNFSYSEDPRTDTRRFKLKGHKLSSQDNSTGLYVEEYPNESSLRQEFNKGQGQGQPLKESTLNQMNQPQATNTQVLLEDIGNDRKNAHIALALSDRPKSVWYAPENETQVSETRGRTSARYQMEQKLLNNRGPPLLGYDWIAGLLENDPATMDKSDAYFDDLRNFRRRYKDDCVSRIAPKAMFDTSAVIDDTEIKDPAHSCIHDYTINDRLFTYPMNVNEDGESICPVCVDTRKEPTEQDPGFVRVSIPISRMTSPYRIKPRRRRSLENSDSMALAQHCVAGWECSKPSMLPSAKGVSLKSEGEKLKQQCSTTNEIVQQMADSNSQRSRLTEDLLNTSHSIRQSQREADHKLTRQAAMYGSLYPLL